MRTVVRGRGRWVAAALAAVLASPIVALAQPSSATATFSLSRLAGADRFATAQVVATTAMTSAATAIIATGFNYPDALSASFAAGAGSPSANVPILLVNSSDPVPPATLGALSSLDVKNVVIVGGTDAVGSDVQQTLASTTSTSSAGGDLNVIRVAGATRYDTMEAIDVSGATVGTYQGKNTAFIATGDDFPDALGAAPISYADHFPIILTDPNTLSPEASTVLKDLNIQQVLILGGTTAVSSAVESSINNMGIPTLNRFNGTDRSDTSSLLAAYAITNFGFSDTAMDVASGDESYGGADALSTGPLGGITKVPTLITNTVSDPGQVVDFATAHASTLATGYAIGGDDPLPGAIVTDVETAGGNATATTTTTGTITLTSTTTAPGGTLDGTITSPSTVKSIVASGCGLTNSAVAAFSATAGTFTVTIPTTQAVGTCTLTFTVTFNNGNANQTDPFSITVADNTDALAGASLTKVAATRGTTPGATDSAVFTFNQTLSTQVPSPDDFRLYQADGAFAFGTGVTTESTNSWTVLFPPGSVVNAVLGSVRAGTVTNTAGDANFPTSVPITSPVLQTATSPITTNDADLTSVSLGQQMTIDPASQQLAAGAPAAYTAQFGFDKAVQVQPATTAAGGLYFFTEKVGTTTYDTTFCVPTVVVKGAVFQTIQANGVPISESAQNGFPSAYTQPVVTSYQTAMAPAAPPTPTCTATTGVTVAFAGTAANLSLATGEVQTGRVEAIANDTVGNPLGSAVISGGTTPTWPVLQEALEEPGVGGSTTAIELIFNEQLPFAATSCGGQTTPPAKDVSPVGDFDLIEGNGTLVPATSVSTGQTSGNSSAITAIFPSGTSTATETGVAGAVGFAIANGAVTVCTNANTFGGTAIALTGGGAPVDQVDIPQLIGVTLTAGETDLTGSTVVFTFDRTVDTDTGLADAPKDFVLYNADGGVIAAANGDGTLSTSSPDTVTFSCEFDLDCTTGFSDAYVTAAAGGAGGFQDTSGNNPPLATEQSVTS